MPENWLSLAVFAAGQVFALIWIVSSIRGDTKALAKDIEDMKTTMKQLVEVLIVQGRQEERQNSADGRLTAQGQRIDDLTRKIDRFFEPKTPSNE